MCQARIRNLSWRIRVPDAQDTCTINIVHLAYVQVKGLNTYELCIYVNLCNVLKTGLLSDPKRGPGEWFTGLSVGEPE